MHIQLTSPFWIYNLLTQLAPYFSPWGILIVTVPKHMLQLHATLFQDAKEGVLSTIEGALK